MAGRQQSDRDDSAGSPSPKGWVGCDAGQTEGNARTTPSRRLLRARRGRVCRVRGLRLVPRPRSSSTPVWINRFSSVSFMVVGLVALACCWAISGPPTGRPPVHSALHRRRRRARDHDRPMREVWLAVRMELDPCRRGSPGADCPPTPSAACWIHRELGDSILWLRALVAGLVLAGAVSPFADVRRLTRTLVAWRGPRIWLLAGVAFLVPAACAAAAEFAASRAAGRTRASPVPSILWLPVAIFVVALLMNMPLVFAWFGFVDGRLARLVSPLVVGLVIGRRLSCHTSSPCASSRPGASALSAPSAFS